MPPAKVETCGNIGAVPPALNPAAVDYRAREGTRTVDIDDDAVADHDRAAADHGVTLDL